MKKLFAALMALMMALLPALGMAEGGSFLSAAADNGRAIESVTTFVPGKDLTGNEAVDKIIDEVLSALSMTYYWQEQGEESRQAGLRVKLSGNEVLTADFATKDGEMYLTSDLMADTTLAMKPDEMETVQDKFLDLFVRKGLLEQEQLDQMRAEIEAARAAQSEASINVDYEKMMEGFLNNEELLNEFVDWVESVANRIEDVDVSGQPENSDPATEAQRLTLTAEDVVQAWEMIAKQLKANEEYMKLLDQTVKQSGEYKSGAALLDDLTEKVSKKLPETMKEDAVVTVYTAEDALVALTADMAFVDGADTAAINMTYRRLTEDGVATHGINYDVTATENGQPTHIALDMTFKVTDDGLDMVMTLAADDSNATMTLTGKDNSLDGVLTVTADGQQATVTLKANWETADEGNKLNATLTIAADEVTATLTLTANWTATDDARKADAVLAWELTGTPADGKGQIDLTFEEKKTGENDAEMTVVAKVSQDGKHLVTVVNESKTVDPYASIATDDVLRPAQMTDDELDKWFDDVTGNLQVWLIKLVQSLPASVLMLFMNME